MIQILTRDQALVVAIAITTLAAVDGRPTRMSLADGEIRIRCKEDGEIVVKQIGPDGKIAKARRYSSLSYFIGQHQVAA
ncbi:MAG TPA: hypothetical protein VN541_05710 [Tepidisphaeraceae bacterium]|nr:hypothetical protein [Tepidisphaeraceae bacterium]